MAEYCTFYRVEHYLPLRKETKIYQRRKVTVEKPVFPGYVFADVPQPNRQTVLKSGNLVRLIEVRDQQRFVHEISQVRQALAIDATLGATAAIAHGKNIIGGAAPDAVEVGIRAGLHEFQRLAVVADYVAADARDENGIGRRAPSHVSSSLTRGCSARLRRSSCTTGRRSRSPGG